LFDCSLRWAGQRDFTTAGTEEENQCRRATERRQIAPFTSPAVVNLVPNAGFGAQDRLLTTGVVNRARSTDVVCSGSYAIAQTTSSASDTVITWEVVSLTAN
jgi:hypothetical protein